MKIISNYNLSIYQKTNNQKTKTNPNFGISTKNLFALPLGITAAGIGATRKLMPVNANTVLGMYGNPAAGKKVSGLIDLPIDEYGSTKLHHWCEDGNVEKVKKFLDENSDINLSQMDRYGHTYMYYAIKSKQEDLVNLIANMDNYNPAIANRKGWTDLHYLCGNGYTDVVKTLLEKHPEIDFNQQTVSGSTCMSLAIDNEDEDIINLIAGMDRYNPTIPGKKGWTDLHYLCDNGYADVVKTLLEKHPDFDINQLTNNDDTCMSLAIDNEDEDIINLIAGMDSYNPAIADEDGYTDFHRLCEKGYTEAVKTLLEKHPEFDINQKTKYSDTCMSLAIDSDEEYIINLIAGMDSYNPTIADKKGWTDLHCLCRGGYTDVVKTLLEKHPEFDINKQTKEGYTCMYLALCNKHDDTVNLIAGMDKYNPTIADEDGYTDFHRLCRGGYTDVVKTLLEKHPDFNINQQTRDGDTCMSLAVQKGHLDLANLIAGMDSYNPAISDENGWTDLHWLCGNGYTDVVKTLLEKHPDFDLNQKTKKGDTCMSIAVQKGYLDLANLIAGMENYKSAIPDEKGWTDLHRLCRDGHTAVVKTILEKHPEIDLSQHTNDSNTCMSIALIDKRGDIINLIAGMDNYNPGIPDKHGWTDLHLLCMYGYTDVVKTLLEKHPEFDINQKTDNGRTCMSLAIDFGHKDLVNLIAGMENYNPDIPDKKDWTDFHRLCKEGYTDVVKTLLKKHPEFDVNQQTKDGDTCMSLAIKNKQKDIINLITGMDNYNPEIPGKNGLTDLQLLGRCKYYEALHILVQKRNRQI